jgi:hypothetical protein
MLRLFTRAADTIRLETQFDRQANEYLAVLHLPEGLEIRERFSNAKLLDERLVAIEQRLAAQRWRRSSGQ